MPSSSFFNGNNAVPETAHVNVGNGSGSDSDDGIPLADLAKGPAKACANADTKDLLFEASALLDQPVSVLWENEDGGRREYRGMLVEQGIAGEQDWFRVLYNDGDSEWMSLETLENDGTLSNEREKRVRWCLVQHTDAASSSEVPRHASSEVPRHASSGGHQGSGDSDDEFQSEDSDCSEDGQANSATVTSKRVTRAQVKQIQQKAAKRKTHPAKQKPKMQGNRFASCLPVREDGRADGTCGRSEHRIIHADRSRCTGNLQILADGTRGSS